MKTQHSALRNGRPAGRKGQATASARPTDPASGPEARETFEPARAAEPGAAGTAPGPLAERLAVSERWFHTLVRNSSDVIGVLEADGRIVYANPAAERAGLDLAGGVNLLDLVHPDDLERAKAAFSALASGPRAHELSVYRLRTKSGQWRVFEAVVTDCVSDPDIGGIVVNARDVTERANLTRVLATLGQANQVLVHATDEAPLLDGVCQVVVGGGGYLLAWVGYAEEGVTRTVRPVASAGRTGYLEGLQVSWGEDEHGQDPTGLAVRKSTVRLVRDVQRSPKFAPWRASADRYGLRSSCALPLIVAGTTIGALSIYADEPGAFDKPAVGLLRELSEDLAYGIGRLRDAAALAASNERFRLLADSAPIGILETPAGGGIGFANRRLAEIAGRSIESLLGRGWIDSVHPDDRAEVVAFLDRVRPTMTMVKTQIRLARPDGEVRHVLLRAAPKGQGPDSGHVTSVEDITEEVRAREELTHQAFYDTLTGLPNRALFLDRLHQELVPGRNQGPRIAVLLVDLDQFKIVNDSLGHATGDAVLKEVGDRFARAVRAGGTAARFSGDEFAFIIRDVHDAREAVGAAKRLLAVLEAPVPCAAQDVTMTGSIGIVVPGRRTSAMTVLRDADTAMYQAKAAGRNSYALFDKALHRRSVARLAMEGDLRQALARRELELYYQPVVELTSERPIGAEALLRWHHPGRGMVPPLEFIPVAEDSGLIRPIGDWVLEQAVSQLASWDAQAGGPRLEVLAVNVSARQLDDQGTSAVVRDLIKRYGVAPFRLSIEVTESAVMTATAAARRSLERFKALGLRVAIDDFGTGYSSLAYLHTLPVTTVKVDRSFIERMGGPDDSVPVVKAIVELSQTMGLRVVAEGIGEKDEQRRALLAQMGCRAAQGFYWSPALPAAQFAGWWAEAEVRAAARASAARGARESVNKTSASRKPRR
jgi:diguanylate cyclase (GGDEF)-like protein/PAS domain S-box-containing protein